MNVVRKFSEDLILANCPLRAHSNLSNNEILREAIHISGFAVPFVCIYLFNSRLVSLSLLLVTIFYAVSEFARTKGVNVPVFSKITRKAAASNPEINHFVTAPMFFAMGIILTLLIFPPSTAYASITVLTLGDGFATIFGRKFGKKAILFNRGKTLEGSIFGFVFAFLGATLFVNPTKALIATTAGMLAECLPTPIDDNLIIPLASGLALTLFTPF